MTITVELIGQDTLLAKLKGLPDKFRANLYKEMKIQAELLKTYIQRDELSGQLLNVRTGDLRDSISEDVSQSSSEVVARVFSAGNLPYAKPLNDGCGPYDIYPVNGKALMFMSSGSAGFNDFYGLSGESAEAGMTFAKVVHHPGQKARHYMEKGLEFRKEAIVDSIQKTLKGSWVS